MISRVRKSISIPQIMFTPRLNKGFFLDILYNLDNILADFLIYCLIFTYDGYFWLRESVIYVKNRLTRR